MRLRATQPDGTITFHRGRCKATNLCDYCARLSAVETSEMLWLDALDGSAPVAWSVLTTRTATPRTADFYRAREYVVRAVRREWPAEYAGLVEFTTGYGTHSGGRRRPHWNLGWKGVPLDAIADLGELVASVWCRHVDAKPEAQHTQALHDAAGFIRYVALHFQKESQRPPRGWRGHRFICSRGYFAEGAAVARQRARTALQRKRALYKAAKLLGPGHLLEVAEMGADYLLAKEAETEWAVEFVGSGTALRPLDLAALGVRASS